MFSISLFASLDKNNNNNNDKRKKMKTLHFKALLITCIQVKESNLFCVKLMSTTYSQFCALFNPRNKSELLFTLHDDVLLCIHYLH